MNNEQIVNELIKKGITCNSCWWREGSRCYVEPCERLENGRSTKMADKVCEQHTSKRSVMGDFFSDEMLTIQSEENEKSKGNNTGNY